MVKASTPFLDQDIVVIPRRYLHAVGGAVTLRDTREGVTLESHREKKLLRAHPRWKRFSDRDPLVSLIGTLEDEVPDVSHNKYKYVADAYGR